jgi:hypothetical protein
VAERLDGWSTGRRNTFFPLEPMIRRYSRGVGRQFIGCGAFKPPTDAQAPPGTQNISRMPYSSAPEVGVDAETGRVFVHPLGGRSIGSFHQRRSRASTGSKATPEFSSALPLIAMPSRRTRRRHSGDA